MKLIIHVPFFLVSFLTISILSSCTDFKKIENTTRNTYKDQKQNSNNRITLIVKDSQMLSNENRVDFFYKDSIGGEFPVIINKINTTFNVDNDIVLIEPRFLNMPYFLKRGETLNVTLSDDWSIKFQNNSDIQRTNEINYFKSLYDITGSLNFVEDLARSKIINSRFEFLEVQQQINNLKLVRLKNLDSLKVTFLSKIFCDYAKIVIENISLQDSLKLIWYCKDNVLPTDEYDSLLSNIAKHKLLEKSQYTNYFALKSCDILVNLLVHNRPEGYIKSTDDFMAKFDAIDKHFNNTLKSYLLYRLMTVCIPLLVEIPKDYVKRFDILNTDAMHANFIALNLSKNNKLSNLKKGNRLIDFNNKIILDIKDIINKYPGKYLYIDFWSSWCIPCRKQMIYSKQLKKQLINKEIEFIYISIDKDETKWENGIVQEDLINCNNYLLLNIDKSHFIKNYKISSIPRYMIVDKKGNIINTDAPQPSNPELKKLLDKLLTN